jgi:hypothetical protein
MTLTGKHRSISRKPASVPLWRKQIPHKSVVGEVALEGLVFVSVIMCTFLVVFIFRQIQENTTDTTQYVDLNCCLFRVFEIQCVLTTKKKHTHNNQVKFDNCYFVIKPTRCTNFINVFCHETLHVSDSSSVHRQKFIHCTLSNGICHTGL